MSGPERLRQLAGPAVVLVATAYALWLSWQRWPDVLIDFGKELYMPWQLAEGRVLYRDLESYLGPLSPYLNSLWFRLFGVSLRTLVAMNLVLWGVLALGLHALLRRIGDRLTTAVAMLVFVLVFGFSQLSGYGNYNFVTPYTHEATHGTLLSVLALVLWAVYLDREQTSRLVGVGLALGLAALGRPEPCVAAAVAIAVTMALVARSDGWTLGIAARRVGTVVGTALVPLATAWGLLALAMPGAQAASGVVRGFTSALDPELRSLAFFAAGMGIDRPAANLLMLLGSAAAQAALGAALAGVALALGSTRNRPWIGGASFAVVAAAASGSLLLPGAVAVWIESARGWPLFVLAVAATSLGHGLRRGRTGARLPRRLLVQAAFATFALCMLGKVVLHCRIHHYGFVQAMPAALVLVWVLLGPVPDWLARRGGSAPAFRGAALGLVLGWVVAVQLVSQRNYAAKTTPVGSGPDAFLADRRGEAVQQVLQEIEERVPRGGTLAVLPEGAMLNYLARRPSSTRFPILMPTEFAVFGEEAMRADFEASPPDFLVLAHKDTSEFGYRFFGIDFGRTFRPWVGAHYRAAWLTGAVPLQDERFGIMLLERTGP